MKKKSFSEYRHDIAKYKLSLLNRINDPLLVLDYKYANGCGSATAWFDFVPDTNWGVDISSPCHSHDIKWEKAQCYFDLIIANIELKEDLDKIVKAESNSFMYFFRERRNDKYYYFVRVVGTDDYAKERGFI